EAPDCSLLKLFLGGGPARNAAGTQVGHAGGDLPGCQLLAAPRRAGPLGEEPGHGSAYPTITAAALVATVDLAGRRRPVRRRAGRHHLGRPRRPGLLLRAGPVRGRTGAAAGGRR